jgi:hypothetical protein
MTTKRKGPTLRDLLEELRHDDALERPRIARVVIDPARPAEAGGATQR